jgi:hypothetical protein
MEGNGFPQPHVAGIEIARPFFRGGGREIGPGGVVRCRATGVSFEHEQHRVLRTRGYAIGMRFRHRIGTLREALLLRTPGFLTNTTNTGRRARLRCDWLATSAATCSGRARDGRRRSAPSCTGERQPRRKPPWQHRRQRRSHRFGKRDSKAHSHRRAANDHRPTPAHQDEGPIHGLKSGWAPRERLPAPASKREPARCPSVGHRKAASFPRRSASPGRG